MIFSTAALSKNAGVTWSSPATVLSGGRCAPMSVLYFILAATPSNSVATTDHCQQMMAYVTTTTRYVPLHPDSGQRHQSWQCSMSCRSRLSTPIRISSTRNGTMRKQRLQVPSGVLGSALIYQGRHPSTLLSALGKALSGWYVLQGREITICKTIESILLTMVPFSGL